LAARVLCVSERTAADFVQLHPDAAHRVCVVPHGVDPRFSATGPPADLPWDLGPDCILAVGRLRSKKNLATLLDAFALRLAARGDGANSATAGSTSDLPVEQLVLAGPDGDAREALELRAARPDLAGRVRFLGFVSDDLLPQLYRHARCLVFPSLFEGFGLPVLEAMACGRPVLVSEQGAVAEAVGGAAHAVDGRDPGRLAKGLAAVLDDADHRQQLVAAGREHAASRSAACAAAEMLKVYEQFR
jgi:alpha-1,3-rhamnosyl/mannosyltransferase